MSSIFRSNMTMSVNMNNYNYSLYSIQLFVVIVCVQGEVPGVKSLIKCNEYHNVSLYTHLWPVSEEEIEFIRKIDSGYIPENAFLGGYNAEPKQLRFIAALGYGNDTDKEYLCGGSLISEEFVITAAHCVFSKSLGPVKYVRLGDLNLTSAEDDQWVQELEVKEYLVHPKYEPPKKYHDLALLKLNKPAVLNEYVQTICLEPQRIPLLLSTLYAAGWGALGYGKESSSHLQVGELASFYIQECRGVYKDNFGTPQGIVDDFQMCAGGKINISDTCAGDSGGPLFYVNDENPRSTVEVLTGITSFGKPCGSLKIPGVYTRVSYYIEWIESIIWPDNN